MIQAPQININGTDKESLLKQYTTAYMSAAHAVDMLRLCAPHGRDYQTLSDEHFERAKKQHTDRMLAAKKLANELLDVCEQIQAQGR